MKCARDIGLICLLIISFFVFFNPSYAMGQFFFLGHPLMQKKAPDFTLTSMAGKKVSFKEYRGNNPAILFFWATWCPHCRQQIPQLNREAANMGKKGIKLLLIDLQEEAGKIKAYLNRTNTNLEVLLDEDVEVSDQYSVMGVPTYFLIDKKGIIRAVEHELPGNYEQILAGNK